ncbi:MAG: ABC transporter permease [Firmicutes bacterium]|nr:ABC transporter permease [Bacillota bacterium]
MKLLSDTLIWISANQGMFIKSIVEHLYLVGLSVGLALLVGVPLGLLLSRSGSLAHPVMSLVNLSQMLPSLALLALMLPLFGVGVKPAVMALFIRSVLPILQNTYVGIMNVDRSFKEAAIGMGMTPTQMLIRVEFPLALYVIMAGIKTAVVLSISLATLSALIGAGGLGNIIFTGIHVLNEPMILTGSISTTVLAVGSYYVMSYLEKVMAARPM